jgi:hypothetical protein
MDAISATAAQQHQQEQEHLIFGLQQLFELAVYIYCCSPHHHQPHSKEGETI